MFTLIFNTFYINIKEDQDTFKTVVDVLIYTINIVFILNTLYIMFPFVGTFFRGVLIKLASKNPNDIIMGGYYKKLLKKQRS